MQRLQLALSITIATLLCAANDHSSLAQSSARTSSGQVSKLLAVPVQAPVPVSGSLTVTTAPASVQTSSAAATQSASSSSTDAQQKAYKQKRLAAIKKMKFDRRPSARIQAWAAQEKNRQTAAGRETAADRTAPRRTETADSRAAGCRR